jgi:hypothetical protein
MIFEYKIEGNVEDFFDAEKFFAFLDLKTVLDTYAEVAREVLITETQAGRFANGSNFAYSGGNRKRKYAKRGNKQQPHSDNFVGYKGYRDAKGLQVDFVDFTFTGQTLRGILTSIDLKQALFELELQGRSAMITQGLKEYYDWFSFKKREQLILEKTVASLQSKDLFI